MRGAPTETTPAAASTATDFRRHSWLDPDRKDPEKESYDYKSCRKEGKEYFNELPDYANIKFRPAQGAYEDFKVGGAADHPYMRVEEMYFIEAEAKAQLAEANARVAELAGKLASLAERQQAIAATPWWRRGRMAMKLLGPGGE